MLYDFYTHGFKHSVKLYEAKQTLFIVHLR